MKKQPIEDKKSPNRVRRGGSWNFNARFTRVSYRFSYDASIRLNFLGFRIVRNKDPKK